MYMYAIQTGEQSIAKTNEACSKTHSCIVHSYLLRMTKHDNRILKEQTLIYNQLTLRLFVSLAKIGKYGMFVTLNELFSKKWLIITGAYCKKKCLIMKLFDFRIWSLMPLKPVLQSKFTYLANFHKKTMK